MSGAYAGREVICGSAKTNAGARLLACCGPCGCRWSTCVCLNAMSWSARWARLYSAVVAALSVLVVALVVAAAFRLGLVSAPALVANKDLIDVITKILGAVIVTFGSIASYFRFFKGRTLSPRLKIDAKVEVLPIDAARNFHVLTVEVTNVGSVAIWGLEPRVEIHFHGDREETEADIGDWWTPLAQRDGRPRLRMLDTEESSQFIVQREVPQGFWAVTYATRISLSSGHSWHRLVTASN